MLQEALPLRNRNDARSTLVLPVERAWSKPILAHCDHGLERSYRKQRLAAAFRLFGRFGFDMGGAGHITARDPEFDDCFWVNPLGRHFSRIRVSDLLLVDRSGTILEGVGMVNTAAFAIHSRLHHARPDVVAAAHCHSLYGKAWSSLGRLLDPISQDATGFFEDHALFDTFSGVVVDEHEGDAIAAALGMKKAAILQNHGLLTVGQTVEAATWRYLAMENACKAQLLAEAVGKPHFIEPDVARSTGALVGAETTGCAAFESYLEVLLDEEPDFLD